MKTVTISAHICDKRKTEFFQTIEPLKILIAKSCKRLNVRIGDDNRLVIQIDFENRKELENNFNNEEFIILKGSIRSICEDINIKIN